MGFIFHYAEAYLTKAREFVVGEIAFKVATIGGGYLSGHPELR